MNFTEDRNRLLAAVGAAALIAGASGIIIGRTLLAPSGAPASSQEGEEGDGEAGHGKEGFVPMTPERLAAAGIRTQRAIPGSLAAEILAQATVTATPQGEAALTARADGAITRIDKRLGDPVRAGEAVAWIESRDAAAIAAERSAASARATAARQAYTRELRLFNAKVTARQDLEAAQALLAEAEAELRRTQSSAQAAGLSGDGRHIAVTSLVTGRVTKADARLGAYVTAGTELFRVADPGRIQVEAAVPATDARRIRPGDPAVLELPDGTTVEARVRSATPSLDPESRSATLVLLPTGGSSLLTPGLGMRARIRPSDGAANAIILPEEAVQSVEGRDVVFVRGRGGFQATPVTLGSRNAGRVEVLSGIPASSEVVTTGAFLLKSELGKEEAEH